MLLTLDTTHKVLSLAVTQHNKTLANMQTNSNTLSGDMLLPTILTFFKDHCIKPQHITALACSTGPGSFTGVRIGIAFAKAFHLANKVPIYGLNSFEALAWKIDTPVTVLIDSYRGDFFAQDFNMDMVSEPYIISLEEMIRKKRPVTGFIKDEDKTIFQNLYLPYKNNVAINLGKIFYSAPQKMTPPVPFYIRSADVSY